MLTQRLANSIFTIVILIAVLWLARIADGFGATGLLASSGLPSKFFPLLMLGCISLTAIAVFIIYRVKKAAGGDEGELVFENAGNALRAFLTLSVAVASFYLWPVIGFLPMALIMGPACGLAMGVRSLRIYIILLIMPVVVYLIFSQLLGIQFT